MPLREYQCDACGHRFEVIQKMSDPPLDVCPKCGEVLRKLQAAPAFHLKGSGWYATDYAKKDQSTAKSEDESKGAVKSSADQDKADKSKADKGESKTDSAKSSDSSATSSSNTSTTPSTTPAKTPAKDS